jgi:bifunctional non-homologous end joining protein LigD
MLASPGPLPSGPQTALTWAFEIKWDGMRALGDIGRSGLHLNSRSGRDVSRLFPEVAGEGTAGALADLPRGSVLDGELVAFDEHGLPSFARLAPRIQGSGGASVTYLVFDLLRVGNETLLAEPYDVRRSRLADLVAPSPHVLVPESFDDGEALLDSTRERGLEGVVAKRRGSPYRPGVRSSDWIKVPHRTTRSYVVGGWKLGTAASRSLASLLVGTPTGDGKLLYDGAVGSGITQRQADALLAVMADLETRDPPFHVSSELPTQGSTFVEPILVVDVTHLGRGGQGLLRQASLERVRPDLSYADLLDDPLTDGATG